MGKETKITTKDCNITKNILEGKSLKEASKISDVTWHRCGRIFYKTIKRLKKNYKSDITMSNIKKIREQKEQILPLLEKLKWED